MAKKRIGPCPFPAIAAAASRRRRSAVSDLDGTLLCSSSAFPYYFLIAFDAGSPLRALLLLLFAPLCLLLYSTDHEPAAIELLIFITFAGLRVADVEATARGTLPRHYARGVRADSWALFRDSERRAVVTASPEVMVRPFVEEFLGAEVVGTELEVEPTTRRFTGRVAGDGVLVHERKAAKVRQKFAGGAPPEIGLGDRDSDHPFLALCEEAFMVPTDRGAARAAAGELKSRVVFHDGRLVGRPDPAFAFFAVVFLPVGFVLALIRIFLSLAVPARHVRRMYRLTGFRINVRGNPPPAGSPGCLLVCNHRTALDPVVVSAALGRPVACVTDADGAAIARLLAKGSDVVVCPEGATCREPFVLRFSELFAGLSNRIVPVAVEAKQEVYYGSTVRGWKWLDPFFFFMNPKPRYEVTFLEPLRPEETCGGGRLASADVANEVQRRIAAALGFECTTLTRKDKYMALAGGDGKVA